MTTRIGIRRWFFALAACTILVIACVALADRPIADFLERYLRHTAAWAWTDGAMRLLDLVVVGAMVLLVGSGLWSASGREIPTRLRTWLLCSWSMMWALSADVILKHIFGRTWPDSAYTQDHVFGFHFLGGGLQLGSFPSGTAAIASAAVAVLWIASPRLRGIGVAVTVFLAVIVVVMNYHWLSDAIAGVFLGASLGLFTVALVQRRLAE